MKLLCDEMLGSLARWLRVAGYDTALAQPGMADGLILAQCAREDRRLITRDRALAGAAPSAEVTAILLREGSLDAHARRLAADAGIDWTHARSRAASRTTRFSTRRRVTSSTSSRRRSAPAPPTSVSAPPAGASTGPAGTSGG